MFFELYRKLGMFITRNAQTSTFTLFELYRKLGMFTVLKVLNIIASFVFELYRKLGKTTFMTTHLIRRQSKRQSLLSCTATFYLQKVLYSNYIYLQKVVPYHNDTHVGCFLYHFDLSRISNPIGEIN